MKQYYSFSATEYLELPEVLEHIGSRGRRVMELASLGAPISPGFIVMNDTLGKITDGSVDMSETFKEPIAKMESVFGKKFNDADNPLLIKIVESPMLNMVNIFSTIHNIGLCEKTADGFAKFVGEGFAYQEYGNVVQKIIELELLTEGLRADRKKKLTSFQQKLKKQSSKAGVIKTIEQNRSVFPEKIYTDTYAQLDYVIKLFHKLFSANPTSVDSALLFQTMVFGNFGKNSCFGRYTTHDIITGENTIRGEFYEQAFDEREKPGKQIDKIGKEYYRELERIGKELERHFKEIRRVRFTVENGKLWLIDQRPVADNSTQAEIKTLLDLHRDKVIDDEYLINAIKPGRLAEILHPALDPNSVKRFFSVSGGIAGSVGAAIGRVYFSTDALVKAYRLAAQREEETNFILAMPATFAEDVKAIELAQGVLSSEGGYASHAPVVARSLGKVAMVYPGVQFQKNSMKIGQKTIKEGEYITLNVPYYEEPVLYVGKGSLMKPTPEGSGLLELLDIVQNNIGEFDVHANADQPKEAQLALKFKAKGIGLCRTEHMFFDEKRINKFRAMVIADSVGERQKALNELRKWQVDDFYSLFKTMEGYPVTIRLLDAPLHEFLPHTAASMDEFVAYLKKSKKSITKAEVHARCDMLNEFNPMLGHRGCRIAISYPEIYNMQVSAIFEAAYKLKKEGKHVVPEIMIPLVMSSSEIKAIRNGKRIEGKAITGVREIEESIRKQYGTGPIDFRVGTMIELPAAALQAARIARYADFFSFGTNDLTQTTNGLSRDDFNNFFSDYTEFDLLEENPFKVLGEQVKELIQLASERGRLTRPDIVLGICGEHGAEPANIPFALDNGLNYVSCSPYGIPIAKLAIAQLLIARKNAEAGKKPA